MALRHPLSSLGMGGGEGGEFDSAAAARVFGAALLLVLAAAAAAAAFTARRTRRKRQKAKSAAAEEEEDGGDRCDLIVYFVFLCPNEFIQKLFFRNLFQSCVFAAVAKTNWERTWPSCLGSSPSVQGKPLSHQIRIACWRQNITLFFPQNFLPSPRGLPPCRSCDYKENVAATSYFPAQIPPVRNVRLPPPLAAALVLALASAASSALSSGLGGRSSVLAAAVAGAVLHIAKRGHNRRIRKFLKYML